MKPLFMLALSGLALTGQPAAAQTRLSIPKANITVSGVDGKNAGAHVNDNNLSTHWTEEATPASPPWVSLRLGSCQKVDYVRVAWFKGDQRHYDYTLKVSKDHGTTWTVADAGVSDGLTAGRVVYEFQDASATDVRLESTGNDQNEKVSVNEFEVWTSGAGACGGDSPPPAAAYPAELLGGLHSWKLNQPTGPSNSADTVSMPALAKFSSTPYFKLNAAKTGVNFRAPAGGSRTSANTAYARSELREMKGDGSSPADWSCTGATRGMTLEQTLTHTTTHKAEASIAQIHDDVNDNLMVKYAGPKYPKANGVSDVGTIRANFNNDDSTVLLDGGYRLGDPMTIDVLVTRGAMSVLYKNLRSGTVTQTPAVAFSGVQGGCYFKAGMYISACSKQDLNGNTNAACVKKGWDSPLYETDPNAYSELEIRKIQLR